MGINEIVKKLNIDDEYIEYYGKNKAKIDNKYLDKLNRKDAKLILVTAINPTPYGEGKTTQLIGMAMGMNKIGKDAIAVLREPSLGPVFGIKGGAIGGGKSVIEPMEEINLHFTGDFHAITSANNLLCSVVENSIYFDNKFNLDKDRICIKRAIDMNDRGLRNIIVDVDGKVEYKTSFEITAASEIMAICCLAKDYNHLKEMIDNIIVGYDFDNNPIFAKSFNVTNAMIKLLKDVLKPNLVKTRENTPCIVHLGPFANIAHGCNSLIATKMGLKLADYTFVEAGFGADLGAEKFLDIKCRKGNLKPDLAVIVATCKGLKYHGGSLNENEPSLEFLKKGILNLKKHIENMKKYNLDVVVCINKFEYDSDEEINYIKEYCEKLGAIAEISECFSKGSEGTISLCEKICDVIDNQKENNFKYLYEDNESIEEKINKICKEIYGARNVIFLDEAKNKIKQIEKLNLINYPVCIAKTPLSLTDDPKKVCEVDNFDITIRDLKISNGAGFIVAYAGNIMTMPGLGRKNKYEDFNA